MIATPVLNQDMLRFKEIQERLRSIGLERITESSYPQMVKSV